MNSLVRFVVLTIGVVFISAFSMAVDLLVKPLELSDRVGGPVRKEFNCRGRIYVSTVLRSINLRGQEATLVWFRPDGEIQEESKAPLILNQPESRCVFWIGFSNEREGRTGDFPLGGDYGSSHPFNGIWNIELFVGQDLLASETFQVFCGDF